MRKTCAVFWAQTALDDLDEIVEYLQEPTLASNFLERIIGQATRLSRLPLRGRVVPELFKHSVRSYRELIVAPWRIIYRVDESRVLVHAVLDGRRSLEDLLLDRFLRSRP